MEYIQNAWDVLRFLTYYGAGISEQLWSVFPMLYRTWDKWAFDLISNMAVPIDNYISRGTDVFIAGRSAEGNSSLSEPLPLFNKLPALTSREGLAHRKTW
ncbi:conserved unknown protein [Ectocarpus siliculosus]|uniref:Uncharacterized protein n=1 Tax=Ectocarpus siliculosus TaxID=2880 RepID=D8LU38_ECTSI|nr:conserved unknown protein [Ectocarpus siliculosus]|eukprot:CBN78080.1 conserved unknown protein [Ectocarpus siliculosus]